MGGDDVFLAGGGNYRSGETKQLEIRAPSTSPTAPTPISPTPSPTFNPTPSPTFNPTPSPIFNPTPMPTLPIPGPANPSCQDSSTATFNVNNDLRNKDCAWLANNLEYFQYLCKFLDVGAKCKDTCNACDYFIRED